MAIFVTLTYDLQMKYFNLNILGGMMTHLCFGVFYVIYNFFSNSFAILIQDAAEEGEKNSEKDEEIVRSIFDFEIIEQRLLQ